MKSFVEKNYKLLIVLGLFIALLFFIFVLTNGNNNKEKPKEVETVMTDFSLNFLKLNNNKENVIYSPLSIKYALYMLSEGTNGNTKVQIDELLKDEKITKYDNIENVLSLANSIFIRDTYANNVKLDFKNNLINKYNAEVILDPFVDANNINNWIDKKTMGIIKNMVKDDTVVNSELILINALAIDMKWTKEFAPENTGGRTFYLEDNDEYNATFMGMNTSSDSFSYYKDEDVTLLSMDLEKYNDMQFEFIALMPNDKLSDYIKYFSKDKLNKIMKKTTLASDTKDGLEINIPKFSVEYNLPLKDNLNDLGVIDAFDPNLADLSNISDTGLYVTDAIHKADIEFSEEGIKAAAVTVIPTFDGAILQEEVIPITINKPFMYVISDKETEEIWFVGTIYKPNSWDDDKVNYQYY